MFSLTIFKLSKELIPELITANNLENMLVTIFVEFFALS